MLCFIRNSVFSSVFDFCFIYIVLASGRNSGDVLSFIKNKKNKNPSLLCLISYTRRRLKIKQSQIAYSIFDSQFYFKPGRPPLCTFTCGGAKHDLTLNI